MSAANNKEAPHTVARALFKKSGLVCWRIASGASLYDVTLARDGRATACVDVATGCACAGFFYRHTCKHSSLATRAEATRRMEALYAPVAPIEGDDEAARRRAAAPLNGNREFRLER